MLALPTENQIDSEALSCIDSLARTWRTLYPKNEAMRLAQESYDEDFLVRMAYNSNAIEGNTLTLKGNSLQGNRGANRLLPRDCSKEPPLFMS